MAIYLLNNSVVALARFAHLPIDIADLKTFAFKLVP